MPLFGHHVAVELFGTEYSPETPLEHVMAFGITGVIFTLAVYGAYALVRDVRRRLRRGREEVNPLQPPRGA
jgi:hypothetical protein